MISKKYGNPQLIHEIGRKCVVNGWEFLEQVKTISKPGLYASLIMYLIHRNFWFELANFYQYDKNGFAKALELVRSEAHQAILQICISTNFLYIHEIAPFSYFGQLGYRNALIACAAIKYQFEKTATQFKPLVLNHYDLGEFLFCIHNNLPKVVNSNIKFLIIEDGHWLACELLIGASNIRVFVIDSLGHGRAKVTESVVTMKKFLQQHYADKFSIQYNEFNTQNSNGTCQMFAFDYLRRLYRLKNVFAYLPLPSSEEDLVELPLQLMRSAQIADLRQKIKQHPAYEPNLIVNKKQDTLDDAIIRHTRVIIAGGRPKQMNFYLEHKQGLIRKKVTEYLMHTSEQQRSRDVEEYTIQGFKQRISFIS